MASCRVRKSVYGEDKIWSCRIQGVGVSSSIFYKKLKEYVSCEFNRSADRSILNFASCVNRSRVSHYFPSDWLLAGDSPGCYQGRRDDNTCTISYTETADRHAKVGVQNIIESWLTTQTGTPTPWKLFNILPVNVAADLDVPEHEYVRVCWWFSLSYMFLASSALDIWKTRYAHTCEIAEGGPTAQEVMFVISVGRLASGAFWSYSSLFRLKRPTRQYDH